MRKAPHYETTPGLDWLPETAAFSILDTTT
jgi:hypothetical protein